MIYIRHILMTTTFEENSIARGIDTIKASASSGSKNSHATLESSSTFKLCRDLVELELLTDRFTWWIHIPWMF